MFRRRSWNHVHPYLVFHWKISTTYKEWTYYVRNNPSSISMEALCTEMTGISLLKRHPEQNSVAHSKMADAKYKFNYFWDQKSICFAYVSVQFTRTFLFGMLCYLMTSVNHGWLPRSTSYRLFQKSMICDSSYQHSKNWYQMLRWYVIVWGFVFIRTSDCILEIFLLAMIV